MTDLLPITIEEQIAAVEREVTLRRRVYPRWVEAKRLTQDKADREIAAMEATAVTLNAHRAALAALAAVSRCALVIESAVSTADPMHSSGVDQVIRKVRSVLDA